MSKYMNKKYATLEAYTPGEQPQDKEYVKLNTNESPYPPSPLVASALTSKNIDDLRLYPDPECRILKKKLSGLYKVKENNVFFANGSDDILNFAFMAFSGDNNMAFFPEITYGFYTVFADLNGISYDQIPLKADFTIDYTDYFNFNGLIVIANPNAPTGLALSPKEIEEILKANPDNVVLIDEAYVDFGGESCIPLIEKYQNLLVVQTYSKSRSMAGARLGFAIGSPELIEDLEKIRYSTNPYSINRLTMLLGEKAIDSNDYYIEMAENITKTRQYTAQSLRELGFNVLPSKANFLFAMNPAIDGRELYIKLKEKGILVRHFDMEKIAQYNRITIGSKLQMDFFLKTVKEILNER